jgi:thiosulfate reductase cytochrome b subunit
VWAAAGIGGVIVLAAVLVLAAQWFLGTDAGRSFLSRYPGQYAQPDAPGGYPWWLNWAHFFNAFLMVLVIKTGIQIRREVKPEAYWTPTWNKKRKISLTIWTHNALDLLWVLNGVVFVVLLAVTGYWSRVVPTSWEVFPNAVSAVLQYVSLDWPTAGDWAHYNSAQELAYFSTIFVAAPLAIVTGVRMSGLWPVDKTTLNKAFPVEWARAVHFPVMIYFSAFIIVHVILVFATGALRNLNQIYTGQDATNWAGFWLFVLSLVVIIGAALATRPVIVAPLARLFGRVGR